MNYVYYVKLRPGNEKCLITSWCFLIIFAIEAWGPAIKTELEKILDMQKRAMIFNDAYPLPMVL